MSVICVPIHRELKISSEPPRISAFVYLANYCRWNSTTQGTAAFTVGTAAATDAPTGAHDTPENCAVKDDKTYKYYAQDIWGIQFEKGRGVYDTATHTLTRVVVEFNSEGTFVPINFTSLPVVDMFPNPVSILETAAAVFDTGTLMLFQQTTPPTGWTKQTTHNDKALRVVSGTASSGGTNPFSTVMAQTQVGNTSLSIGQLANHAHTVPTESSAGLGAVADMPRSDGGGGPNTVSTSSVGSGSTHTHTLAMSIQYVDLIIASKD